MADVSAISHLFVSRVKETERDAERERERRHSSDFLDNHAKLNRKSAIYGMQSSEYLDLNQINFQIICGSFITMVMTIVLLVEK